MDQFDPARAWRSCSLFCHGRTLRLRASAPVLPSTNNVTMQQRRRHWRTTIKVTRINRRAAAAAPACRLRPVARCTPRCNRAARLPSAAKRTGSPCPPSTATASRRARFATSPPCRHSLSSRTCGKQPSKYQPAISFPATALLCWRKKKISVSRPLDRLVLGRPRPSYRPICNERKNLERRNL